MLLSVEGLPSFFFKRLNNIALYVFIPKFLKSLLITSVLDMTVPFIRLGP